METKCHKVKAMPQDCSVSLSSKNATILLLFECANFLYSVPTEADTALFDMVNFANLHQSCVAMLWLVVNNVFMGM